MSVEHKDTLDTKLQGDSEDRAALLIEAILKPYNSNDNLVDLTITEKDISSYDNMSQVKDKAAFLNNILLSTSALNIAFSSFIFLQYRNCLTARNKEQCRDFADLYVKVNSPLVAPSLARFAYAQFTL